MDRRTFLKRSMWLAGGALVVASSPALAEAAARAGRGELKFDSDLYKMFRDPDPKFHPFVRWWWNGNKVEAGELARELRLLKAAGIGGVEINPIAFPPTGDDLGIRSLRWLSDEWIDMLKLTFDEAKKLDMTCDLLVGSGWPFGSEDLEGDERAMAVFIFTDDVEGPTTYETSQLNIFKHVDPEVTDPNPERTFEVISLTVVPKEFVAIPQAVDVSEKRNDEVIRVDIPEGKHVFYATVRINAFASVINGAPGAAGSILNHFDAKAVRKYLDRMADAIERRTGPLSQHLRSFFTDSMELEGSNWAADFETEFNRRRGYDLMPYLPFILVKVGRLGAAVDGDFGAKKSPELEALLNRVRFDFELTKAELLYERFTLTYLQWCRDKGVKSRAQAYGRGFFPLESSLGYDIPEGESWTMNWLRHKLGEEMGDEDYRRGRGYTMINKYVSSAAHLTGKRLVSCEEMTNTYRVFSATLELLKVGSDMAAISGITHSVWHGFNYSPPEAPFPGWVQYGAFYNEQNTWWAYWKYLNEYRARLCSQLQNADMYTDIALLPANYDLWTDMGVMTDPFPEKLNVEYTSLVWEAIHKTGGGCDYTSEIIINDSEVRDGKLCYGPKAYGTVFLVEVSSTQASTLAKLYELISQGGRVFCIERYPDTALGRNDFETRTKEVQAWVDKLKEFPDRFILVKKPEDGKILEWYAGLIEQYDLPRYLTVETPDRYLMQNRYTRDDDSEFFFFLNASIEDAKRSRIVFSPEVIRKRWPWFWNPDTGEKFRLELDADGGYDLDLGPAESRLIVFDKNKKGELWRPLPLEGPGSQTLTGWEVELKHAREGWTKTIHMEQPQNLADTEFENFTGEAIYRTSVDLADASAHVLNLGRIFGINELKVNGQEFGVKWFGRRIYDIAGALKPGRNEIEVKVVTTMGNYVRTLTDNETAMRFAGVTTGTHGKRDRNQGTQPMGMAGPVTLYK